MCKIKINDSAKHRLILTDLFNYDTYSDIDSIENTLDTLRECIKVEENRLISEGINLYDKKENADLEQYAILHSNYLALYQQLLSFPIGFQTVYTINKFDEKGKSTDEYLNKPLKMVVINTEAVMNRVFDRNFYFTEYTLVTYEELFEKHNSSRKCKKYKIIQADINKRIFVKHEDAELMLKIKDLIDRNSKYSDIGRFLYEVLNNTLSGTCKCEHPVDIKDSVMVKTQGCMGDAPFYGITDIRVDEVDTKEILRYDYTGIEKVILFECKCVNDLPNNYTLLTLEEIINRIIELNQIKKNEITKNTKMVFKTYSDEGGWLESFNSMYNIFDMPEYEADTDFVKRFGRNLIQLGIM